jgi:hypothetical protein
MAEPDLVAGVDDVLAVESDAFQERVEQDTEVIVEELEAGTFNNPQAIIGLEYEFYGVAESDASEGRTPPGEGGRLMRVPRRLLELIGFEKELGLHNAEMCTSPQPLNNAGIAAQEAEVRSRLRAALDVTTTEGIRLVSDGLWTIPPAGETARDYLQDSIVDEEIVLATNMSDAVRYHSMANTEQARNLGLCLDAPHVSLSADTVMPESLITSIQPHYQVPQATDLPEYFTYALRVAGPLLALAVNTPFFPPDLYDEGVTIEDILDDGWAEHRISVFETVLNPIQETTGKVHFPKDIDSVREAIDRIVADETLVPMPVESKGRFDDEFAHFRLKHGTYWRWVRPVFDGPSRSAANARIEFRPLPAQPTVRDSIAFQVAFAGLMESLPRVEHPVADLDWEVACENFYTAMREGIDADLRWITNDGRETSHSGGVFGDLLAHAADGLRASGLSNRQVEEYLWPLRQRARHGITPAAWKRERAREAATDGADYAEAIQAAQRAYIDRQRDTLLRGSFADWLDQR